MGIIHTSVNKERDPYLISETTEIPDCVPCPNEDDKKPGNPGSFEELHKKVKDLYPQNFEGARLLVQKVLSSHFNVTHAITLSSVTPSGYKFGASYIGIKAVGLHEKYPIVKGDIIPNGNMTANFVHTLGCRFRFKLFTQVANCKYKASSTSIEYRSNDYTLALTLANPNFIKQQGTIVLHFLQAITSRITLGAEIACLRGSKLSSGQQTLMCVAFRYNTGHATWSATLGEAGIHICYYRRASQQLQLGVEIETNMRIHESIATIVYQINIPYADLIFRGIVNSESSIGCVFEKKLYPISESSLIISGLLNHANQQFRVGVGLNIGV
ncbi:mitochondrial import receptor subunit TOM40 homolog 1-like [Polistes fuscatus]|uniref:mitochondrial import receptor subunit TOM40 homolog 1-like n=1 Tax=Polistes fuscatus TaxID=30207 RepID=UPI001CA92608|nr:mitochondrial import receptor subunit TOM40 homolog 1-like [Polistes fuscatus]